MLQQGGIQFDTMASAVLYIPDVMEHVNQEVPDYGFFLPSYHFYLQLFSEWEQFMGDVGGSAGLVLGVSLATILSTMDWLASSTCRFFARVRDSYRNPKKKILQPLPASQKSSIRRLSYDFAITSEPERPYTS